MELEWDFNSNKSTEHDNQALGLSIIPVKLDKTPFSTWGEYQTLISPISIWHSHYKSQGTVGIITGKISGNLECIDIDIKNDPLNTIITEYSDRIPDELLKKLIIQTTPSGGLHYVYRCPETTIEKSQKLALHSNKEVIIETRGEAGYFCTSKINNKIMFGKFDLENLQVEIPIISAKERDFLLETARSLTRYFPSARTKTSKTDKPFVYSEAAINDFNDKYCILDLFIKHDWSVVKEDDEKVYLLRKGSSAQHSGYYFKDRKTFFCFSTSTEFKTEKPYNHFQVLQTLEGNDDYRTALRLLPALGFPVTIKSDKVTADSMAEYLNGIGVRYDSFIQDLTLNGKIIEELDLNTIFIDLKKHFDKDVSRMRFEETIKSHYIQTINPIMNFIQSNKDRRPEGTFEQWLDCLVLKNKSIDKSIVLLYMKKWYVGMIAQALDGEFPNEFFLTLLSTEQGIGKTTFLRNYTIPKELQGYRKEHSLSFDDDFKVLMGQALLIVDDEMDGRSYEMDKTFKTVLSTKELTTRRKYDRRISLIKRRCSFAGSGNNLTVVREQQNRRVLPIEVQSINQKKLSQIDLTDLFMEAYHLFASGFKYSYQQDDQKLLRQLYEDYILKSDVDYILDEFIEHPLTIADVFYITNLDIVNVLTKEFTMSAKRINVPSIGKLLNERGFESVRRGINRTTCYPISRNSRIMTLIFSESQSWRLNSGRYSGVTVDEMYGDTA
jgi:hypothetical protein